ncbi:hypothetical protein RHS01_00293 [Rhizoctonia solani]|uniref:DUF6593 domain-containing protein n=1 Tax=Rhizoctonia solani TaxID=456999 RepID=A0A8H7M8Q2_9AGAM|nr:hypothetical protein RHS01_00293 [Rhizoctonia solani]
MKQFRARIDKERHDTNVINMTSLLSTSLRQCASYGISGGSPLYCTLYHRGVKTYEINTSSRPGSMATITRDGTVVASIEWSNVTLLPDVSLQVSNVQDYGRKTLKWKINGGGLSCTAPDTGFNLAYHNGVAINAFSANKSALDIFDQGLDIQDVLVATWVMMEVIVRGRNPPTYLGGMLGEGPWGGSGGDGHQQVSGAEGDGEMEAEVVTGVGAEEAGNSYEQ